MKTRREIMATRRKRTYTVLGILFLVLVIRANNMLLAANLRSLEEAPDMVWFHGMLVEESVVDDLTIEAEEPMSFEDPITELPERVYAAEEEERTSVETPAHRVPKLSVTAEEYDILLKIGMAEGAGEPIEGVRAIYTVIFNRMAANHLGESTVKGTIYKPYQFSGVNVGQWYTTPSDKIRTALDDVLAGYRSFGPEILFYHYREAATDRAQVNRVKVLYKIGVHEFGIIPNGR